MRTSNRSCNARGMRRSIISILPGVAAKTFRSVTSCFARRRKRWRTFESSARSLSFREQGREQIRCSQSGIRIQSIEGRTMLNVEAIDQPALRALLILLWDFGHEVLSVSPGVRV